MGLSNRHWTALRSCFSARHGALALLIIVAASLAFRIHVSHECSLWLDEVTTHFGVLKPWSKLLRGPSRAHPPLMYLLVAGAIKLVGESETGLRSVSLFFGCIWLLATHELCKELGLSVKRTLFVVALLALSPFFIRHATEARHYSMMAAFFALATTRALRLLRGSRRTRDLLGFAAAVVALGWTHYFGVAYAVALLAAVTAGVLPSLRQLRWGPRVALLCVLLGASAALGVIVERAMHVGRAYGVGAAESDAKWGLNADLLSELPREFAFLSTNNAWALVGQPVLAFVGLILLSARLTGIARLLPLGLGAVPCLAAVFLPSEHFLAARYLAPSAVFYHLGTCVALLASLDGLRQLLAEAPPLRRFAPFAGWVMLSIVIGARLREYPKGFGAGEADYRSLQRKFVTELASDTRMVAYDGFFGDLMTREYRIGSRAVSLERFRRVRGIKRYLIVEFHVDDEERRAELEALVERHFGLAADEWRALPLVRVPHSKYQSSFVARLVQLPERAARGRRKRGR